MNLNFVNEYFPSLDELTPQQMEAGRAIVLQKLRERFASVDLSPGTVTGDHVVAPLSEFIAAADLAFSRFMSDLNLGNVANGVIYSCPFVEGYLGNFHVYDDTNLRSIGVVRLTFSTDAEVTFERNVVFKFGTSDEFRILFSSSHGETFTVLPSTAAPSTADDTLQLVQTSETSWAVDLPVYGAMTSTVAAGTGGVVNKLYPNLTAITTVMEFMRGATPTSLPELARMARKIHHSMSASSRYGIRSTVYHHWPETVMVSPVMPNDLEMVRGAPGTALALPEAAVDIYFRSSRDLLRQTQLVKLYYTDSATHDGVPDQKRFRGRLPFLHSPSKILNIKPFGVNNAASIVETTVYSRATGTALPYGVHFGTRQEEFYVDIEPGFADGSEFPIIPLYTVYDGLTVDHQYAMFEVEYESDPLLKAVAAHMESPDQTAAGVSTVVRAGALVDIASMTIYYHRRAGTRMLLGPAREKIAEYARGTGYPVVFTPSAIHDIMKIAGASAVDSITVSGTISRTPANRWMAYDAGFSVPDSLNDDWLTESFTATPTALTVSTMADTRPSVVSLDTIGAQTLVTIATPRTVRYRVDPAGINFIELA